MRKLFSKVWADDRGAILSIEMLFIIAILVIGLVAGWAGLRAAIVTEFTETGNAILSLNQGYEYESISGDTGGSGIDSWGGPGATNVSDTQSRLTLVFHNTDVQSIDNTALLGWDALSP